MLRKDYKKIQEQAAKIQHEVMERAANAGLHWVLGMWESPMNEGRVERRVGYFEDINEADHMKDYLADRFTKYPQFKFYITTSYDEIEDGGLFDA